MLRTYLGPPSNKKKFRLNIWDKSLAVENVSTIHDHPWDFASMIVAGAFCNVRYRTATLGLPTHHFTEIKTGEGGGMEQKPIETVILMANRPEVYSPGDIYSQDADEIHESIPADGCVTFNERVGDTDHARVFWPYNTEWIDAVPRAATDRETRRVCNAALERWF